MLFRPNEISTPNGFKNAALLLFIIKNILNPLILFLHINLKYTYLNIKFISLLKLSGR